jgi:hypothetical protein
MQPFFLLQIMSFLPIYQQQSSKKYPIYLHYFTDRRILAQQKTDTMKKTIITALPVFAMMLIASTPLFAQNCNPNIPIDGGISALLVAGAGYGIKKLNEKRNAEK